MTGGEEGLLPGTGILIDSLKGAPERIYDGEEALLVTVTPANKCAGSHVLTVIACLMTRNGGPAIAGENETTAIEAAINANNGRDIDVPPLCESELALCNLTG
jgi:hypothetical protein